MAEDSGLDVKVTTSWEDVVDLVPELAGAQSWVCNKGWSPILVAFSASAEAPAGGGIYLIAGEKVYGTAAHIWTKAIASDATAAVGLADPAQAVSGTVAISGAQSPLPLKADAAATTSALSGTISDTTPHLIGPFTPQLARAICLTINATSAASGTAQLLRSVDGGATQPGLTVGGTQWGKYSFTAVTGAVVNEPVWEETSAAATIYLAITLSAGVVTYNLHQ